MAFREGENPGARPRAPYKPIPIRTAPSARAHLAGTPNTARLSFLEGLGARLRILILSEHHFYLFLSGNLPIDEEIIT